MNPAVWTTAKRTLRGWAVRALRLGVGELAVLALWTLGVARPYLNRDPNALPVGGDFVVTTLNHHLWVHARHCGTCALWNGDIRGGAPAFVDTLGASLHPVVIVATLLWGVVNGAKATVVVCFFCAGLAQWLLARALGFGLTARLWGTGMAVAAGDMFGPLVGGLVPVVIANAMFALLFAAAVRLARGGGRRLTVLVGTLIALLAVSGQGYAQIGFLLALPAFAILIAGRDGRWRRITREFALAAGLGILLAGPLLVPLAHFWPHWTKLGDPSFSRDQPLRYLPLNFVIDDGAFYRNPLLGKQPFPEWYLNYVGWPAVALAVVGVAVLARRRQTRLAAFLGIYLIVVLWIASGAPFRWLFAHANAYPGIRAFAAGIETPSLIAGLAICPLLALATAGLDGLLRRPSPDRCLVLTLGTARSDRSPLLVVDHRLLVTIAAVLALFQVRSTGRPWLGTTPAPTSEIAQVLDALHTPDLQWVQPPYGEGTWITQALDQGYKLAFYHRPWDWNGRPNPTPVLVASRTDQPGLVLQAKLRDGLAIYSAPPGQEYAAIGHPDGSRTVCAARGEGGDLDVTCDAPRPGVLVVQEHAGAGWTTQVDGQARSLANAGPWLSVAVPAGHVRVQLRYRPWDVPAGVALLLCGLAIGGYWLVRPPKPATADALVPTNGDDRSRDSVSSLRTTWRRSARDQVQAPPSGNSSRSNRTWRSRPARYRSWRPRSGDVTTASATGSGASAKSASAPIPTSAASAAPRADASSSGGGAITS